MRFKLIQGEAGPEIQIPDHFFHGQGGIGPQGPQGDAGPTGATGATGATGPAGSSVPLSNTVFVDKGTSVAAPDQNGSIGAPYANLTDALAANVDVSRTFILTPGNYATESDIALLSGSTVEVTIMCLTGLKEPNGFDFGGNNFATRHSAQLPGISGLSALSTLRVAGCFWDTENVGCTGNLKLDWCGIFGASGTISGGESAILSNCITARPVTGGPSGVLAYGTYFSALSGTIISTSGTRVDACMCRFGGTVTIVFTGAAGTFNVDPVSNFYWKAATETLTNGSKVIIGDVAA